MLQAKDASSVDYKILSPKEEKIFDVSGLVETKGLFDLGAYKFHSLEESLKFCAQFPDCFAQSVGRSMERYRCW